MRTRNLCLLLLALLFSLTQGIVTAQSSPTPLGLFSAQSDIGTILHPGSGRFNKASGSYTITGSGDNTWFRSDDLHYLYKQVDSPNISLAADIAFIGTTGNDHRKAMLMIRQSLSPDSPYVDVARHGDGLTSLQYRDAAGNVTREVRAPVQGPMRVGIAKRGDYFYVYFAQYGGVLEFSGAAMRLPMHGPFYIGLGVCSHNKDVTETATFHNVALGPSIATPGAAAALVSTLETVPIASTDRSVVYTAATHFEAPNWFHDNSGFLINAGGHLLKLAPSGGVPQPLDTGTALKCNNDHGLSPNGAQIALSDSSAGNVSHISLMPVGGGPPKQLTPDGPSYWHGWSPDGATIAFTGQRSIDGQPDFDIYTIPAAGGHETRLTTSKGLDDGPEYSPDGKYIYFNSVRTGHMQIWRMHPDGSQQEQVTHDATNDWFPHISPDGKWMVFVAYAPNVTGHPPNQDVTLQLVSLADGKQTLLAQLFGGQGTMNVPSWSPDSTQVAFVSYAYPNGPTP